MNAGCPNTIHYVYVVVLLKDSGLDDSNKTLYQGQIIMDEATT